MVLFVTMIQSWPLEAFCFPTCWGSILPERRQTPPTKCISLSVLSWYGVIPSELWDVPQSFCPKPRHCWNKGLGWEAAKKDVARQHQWWEQLNGWENWMQMIIGENLRLFLLKSAWRGKSVVTIKSLRTEAQRKLLWPGNEQGKGSLPTGFDGSHRTA